MNFGDDKVPDVKAKTIPYYPVVYSRDTSQ